MGVSKKDTQEKKTKKKKQNINRTWSLHGDLIFMFYLLWDIVSISELHLRYVSQMIMSKM